MNWYVSIHAKDDDREVNRSNPTSTSCRADKIESGYNISLNHYRFYSALRTQEELDQWVADNPNLDVRRISGKR